MAADGRPRFQVDPGFNDSKELLSIPRRYRLAVRGAWEAAGCWSCNKLTDGWVPVSALKELGVTPTMADFLMDATLWIPGASRVTLPSVTRDGDPFEVLEVGRRPDVYALHVGRTSAVQFENWEKWQMTRARWLSGRAASAERAQNYRRSKQGKAQPSVTPASRVTQDDPANIGEVAVTRDASHRREEKTEASKELSAVGRVPDPAAFPNHCDAHRHVALPPPCGDCRRVRLQRTMTGTATPTVNDRAHAAAIRAACTTCHGSGWLSEDPDDPWAALRRCPACTP